MFYASVKRYGSFHAKGITVELSRGENTITIVEFRETEDTYKNGYPLARIAPAEFVGTFLLDHGSSCDIRETINDATSLSLDVTKPNLTGSLRQVITFLSAQTT